MLPKLHSAGRVAGKHGFSGELHLALNSDIDSKSIQQGNFLFVEFDGKGVPFLIESWREKSRIVKLIDVNDSTRASELEGKTLLLEAPHFEEEDNEGSLVGFAVKVDNTIIGQIQAVEEYPAGWMLVIKNSTDPEFLIPWVDNWFIEADENKKIVELDLPEGLLEL
jgi:16S rRNA processing protein RimM